MSASRPSYGVVQSFKKPNFVQTCNLLSQYIKERGTLLDLNLAEISRKGKPVQQSNEEHPSMAVDSSIDKAEQASSTDCKNPQLTIFYDGRMVVFDDYPAGKAEELVAFARNQSSKSHCGILSNALWGKQSSGISSNTWKEKMIAEATCGGGNDLPIARRSSLHRFLEKRKDRAAVRGPYHRFQERPASYSNGDLQLELKL